MTPRNGVYLMSAQGGAAGGHSQQGPPQTPLLVLTLSGGPWATSGWDRREPSVSEGPTYTPHLLSPRVKVRVELGR